MAAAGAAGRARRREQEKRNAYIRQQISLNRKVLKQRTGDFFAEMSTDGEWIPEDRLGHLLAKAMREEEDRLDADAVQLVLDTAHKLQEKEGMTPPQKGAVAKEPLIKAVDRYGDYIKNRKTIDEIYEKYDKNHDGYLSKKELWKCLEAYERKASRAKNGIVITLMVLEEDVDWIIEESDGDHNGKISHAEYLPAIAAWEQLAQMKLEQSGGCCVIL
jgi:Ca2+-binding EF-hand superfamily protein